MSRTTKHFLFSGFKMTIYCGYLLFIFAFGRPFPSLGVYVFALGLVWTIFCVLGFIFGKILKLLVNWGVENANVQGYFVGFLLSIVGLMTIIDHAYGRAIAVWFITAFYVWWFTMAFGPKVKVNLEDTGRVTKLFDQDPEQT